jgi:putative endonuclease
VGIFLPLMFFLYILYSKFKDRYYVGFTSDILAERIRRHNSNHKGFTGGIGDWKLVFQEKFQDKRLVMQREKQIKKWKSRKMIEELIKDNSSVGLEHPLVRARVLPQSTRKS